MLRTLRVSAPLFAVAVLVLLTLTAATAVPLLGPTAVDITPATPYATAPLVAVATPAAPVNVTYEYQWRFSVDGGGSWSAWGAVTGDTVAPSALAKFQQWQVQARGVTGVEPSVTTSAWVQSATASILDSPPSAPTIADATPVTAHCTDNLVVEAGFTVPAQATDPDGDEITFAYQWRVKSSPGAPWINVPLMLGAVPTGADTATLDRVAIAKGMQFLCRVRGVSGAPALTSADFIESNVVTVVNTPPPAPGSVAISPASPVGGQGLTALASGGIDLDGDGLVASYEWSSSTDGGFTWSDWLTGNSIDGTLVRRGDVWRVRARYNDGEADGEWRESTSVAIGNNLPVLAATPELYPASLGHPASNEDLMVARNAAGDPLRVVAVNVPGADATDADLDAITYKYQWAKSTNGVAYGSWFDGGAVLSKDQTTRGEWWKARVAPYDGFDYGDWVECAAVQIANAAAFAPTAVAFDPAAPVTGEAVTATASGAVDPDGDDLTFQYSWLKSDDGGTTFVPAVPAVNAALLPAGVTRNGDLWRVQAWANDGNADGLVYESDTLTIGNAAPSAPTAVTLTPASPTSSDDLVAEAEGAADLEDDALALQYRWLRSQDIGTTWQVFVNASATLTAGKVKRGDQWKVQVRASDGQGVSAWRGSNVVTIGNSAPATVLVQGGILPDKPNSNDSLQGYAAGATDVDGDAVTYLFDWAFSEDGGGTYSDWGNPGQTLTGVTLVKGQLWKCRIQVADGTVTVPALETDPVTVVGMAPTAPLSVTILPANPANADDLTAKASGSTDSDGDTIKYFYQWASSDDAGQTWSGWGNNGAVLPAAATTRGQLWKARARAWDRTLVSPWVESAVLTILNTPPAAPTVSIVPGHPGPDQDLRARATATDADGDALTYEYQWSRSTNGGTTWSGWNWTGVTLSGDVTDLHDTWRVRARAQDKDATTDWTISPSISIRGMLLSITPRNGSANAVRSGEILIAFAQPVVESSAESHFQLQGGVGGAVAGTFRWVTPNLTVRFAPAVPLDASTSYTITLASGIALQAGGTIDWAETFGFTTGSEPVVLTYSPTTATAQSSSNIVVLFDQNMHRTSVVNALTITPFIPGKVYWLGKQLSYDPATALAPDTTYTVTIGLAARSSAGVNMRRACRWSFTTPEAVGAVALTTSAASTAGGAQISVNLSSAAQVQVVISNVAGRVIATLPTQSLPQGLSTLLWNGRSATGAQTPSGTYLVRVEALSSAGVRTSAGTVVQR